MIWALLATFLAGNVLGVFAMAMIGIHIERHHMQSGAEPAATHVELTARRLMGVYVRKHANPSVDDGEGR